ncbi:hypothetical protein [Pandoraea sp.]|uniref:hypothetical protein n=1 Tax=Pandoraea sp. TaxID=1883445 RepID=UPI0035B4C057
MLDKQLRDHRTLSGFRPGWRGMTGHSDGSMQVVGRWPLGLDAAHVRFLIQQVARPMAVLADRPKIFFSYLWGFYD